jgi:hypothetical protein
MPDRVPELFAELKRADVPVPPAGRVADRGRQLRRRARLKISAAVVAVIAATGLIVQLVGIPGGSGRPAEPNVSPRPTSPAPVKTSPPAHTTLPPAGSGPLILGLNANGQFVMTRTGPGSPAVPVPGLPPVVDGATDIATDPTGGWVVTYAAGPSGSQAAGLAVVTTSGRIHGFGPVFTDKVVTSVAVSPDGNRVAVALCPESGSATAGVGKAAIEVLPTPGHAGGTRTWTIPAPLNWVKDLSWAPNGEELSYAVGFQTGGGIDGYPVTLSITAPGSVAPVHSGWPPAGKGASTATGKAACPPDGGAWLGTTGQFAAVEECGRTQTEVLQPANASNGTTAGPAVTIPDARPGCLDAALDSAPSGNPIVITYCGVYLDDNGRISQLPGGLTAAALVG